MCRLVVHNEHRNVERGQTECALKARVMSLGFI